jgi:hypothetical protein
VGGTIISPPASVAGGATTGGTQQGFDEVLSHTLTSDVQTSDAPNPIPTGTVVNSHMIFLDTGGVTASGVVTWCFCGRILGVIKDEDGSLEAASNTELGSPCTSYPGAYSNRGLEDFQGDQTITRGCTLEVNMHVTSVGDWIRVLTAADDGLQQGVTFSLRNATPSASTSIGLTDPKLGYTLDAGQLLTVGDPSGAIRAPHPAMAGASRPEVISEASALGLSAPAGGVIELDDFSFGRDRGNAWGFSVQEGAWGCAGCLPPSVCSTPSDVYTQGYQCATSGTFCCPATTLFQAAADVYRVRGTGGNTLVYDGDTNLGLIEGYPGGDDIDGLDVDTKTSDLCGNFYFTADTATASANGYSGADILVRMPCDAVVHVYASAADLNLYADDDIDALAIEDRTPLAGGGSSSTPNGVFDRGIDKVYFSIKRGSHSIGAPAAGTGVGITEGDILSYAAPGAAHPRIELGHSRMGFFANPVDELDALDRIAVPAALACYANCDESTLSPVLNVVDFVCFLNRYAANDPYANCDDSTTPPILNVNDFTCFLNQFAAGCQ